MQELWPHQEAAIAAVEDAIARRIPAVVVQSPTGGGKTRVASELIELWLRQGLRVVLYTNRLFLLEQLSKRFREADLLHGIRAAGYADDFDLPLQISSIATENSRLKAASRLNGAWQLHGADRVVVDEARLQASGASLDVLKRHKGSGAHLVGFDATPHDLAHLYDELIQAGTNSQLRECGAIVRADHYGPDEPDMRKWKKIREGVDLSGPEQEKAMPPPVIWGRVWEWFGRLNPDCRPTILFAPSVEASIWFAQQFERKGVKAAHVDGEDVWRDGGFTRASRDAREDLLEDSRNGTIKVICNRFVLREGLDCPWLVHGILATVFGSLPTYLQTGGRLLRAARGKEFATIQDHGGNWWRHGSLNDDRMWKLSDREASLYHRRANHLRANPGKQPFRCPECARILIAGRCPNCGFRPQTRKVPRPVIAADGTLSFLSGDVFRARPISQRPDGPAKWERMFWRSRTARGQRTFRAAAALFARENHFQWPDPAWPFMPLDGPDAVEWEMLVADVPMDKLIPKEQPCQMKESAGPAATRSSG